MPNIHRLAWSAGVLSLVVISSSQPAGAQRPAATRRAAAGVADRPYFPGRFDWQHKTPAEVGMDAATVDEAVKLAIEYESPSNKDLTIDLATTFGAREPYDTPIGPVKARAFALRLYRAALYAEAV